MDYELLQGNCLKIMPELPPCSVDMILCDLPYGVTARNAWDEIIPFEPLWEQYERIIKPNGAIALFGQGLFSARLIISKPRMYRYSLVWDKVLPSGFLNANRIPLRQHEDIHIFYNKLPLYNPQKTKGKPCHSKGHAVGGKASGGLVNNNYHDYSVVNTSGDLKHPTSILRFPKPHPSKCVHPTQKPVELCEHLIRTYTKSTATVLDNCMGSGTTGVACMNTGRRFIGIESDERYFQSAKSRITAAQAETGAFAV